MTRAQIMQIRGRGYGTEKDLHRLLATAERALDLEEVLAAAKAERSARMAAVQAKNGSRDLDAHREFSRAEELRGALYAAIDRAEGRS